jgi:alkaline phosphatase D
MTAGPLTVVQISDIHLNPADAEQRERFDVVWQSVQRQQPDIIIASGDVSEDGFKADGMFEQIKTLLDQTNAPVHVIPGNHDVGEPDGQMKVTDEYLDNWRNAFGNDRFAVQRNGWTLIGLNSQIVGSERPEEAEQLEWLDEQLAGADRVAIFLHQPPYVHQPDESFGDMSDYWGLRTPARFDMLKRFNLPQVKLIASGHVHWYRAFNVGARRHVWCPSTSFIVDDAKFPPDGGVFGYIRYQFNGTTFTDELVELDLPYNCYAFNRPAIELPGREPIVIGRLMLDFTGTLSRDGVLINGVAERLRKIAATVRISVLTADTFGKAKQALEGLPLSVEIIQTGRDKAAWIEALNPDQLIVIGNGRNDVPWVKRAAIGIAVVGPEGAAGELIKAADVVVRDINDALDMVLHPLRLKATLRD